MLDEYKEEQQLAYKIVTNSIKKNKLSHAYLFETNGYKNKEKFILSFAKTLLCPYNYTNCNNCSNCHICNRIDKNIYSELKIINPDGMWIKKEQLIELQDDFKTKSLESSRKVYIINNAECLNTSSANSLLKFLEEPEDNIIAILSTDNIHQLLDTIISRCQIISLANIQDVKDKTCEEKLKIYLNINENVLDILNNTLDYIFFLEKNHLETIIYNKELVLNKFDDKLKLEQFFEIMILFYKDVLDYKLIKKNNIFDLKDIEKIAKINDIVKIQEKINYLIEAKNNLKVNANMNLLLDKLVIDIEGGINE